MKLVRTFHPVGHGAFYTEQFYEKEKCVFTAVYDCGSKMRSADMDLYIDANFSNQSINAVFISHLHNDHISGISHLLQKNECYNTKIFIPFLTPEQKIASYIHNLENNEDGSGRVSNDLIERIYTSDLNERVVEVLPDEYGLDDDNGGNQNLQPIEISTCPNKLEKGIPLKGVNGSWMYYPYNTNHVLPSNFVDYLKNDIKIIKNNDVDFSSLKELCENQEDFNNLLKNYKEMVGHYNEYSMTVYSGSASGESQRCFCLGCGNEMTCYQCGLIVPDNPNCLYMGDFKASEENVSKLIGFYKKYFFASKTIQVPHHGSAKLNNSSEYGYKLFNSKVVAVISTNFHQYPGVPSANLILEIHKRNALPKFVTDKVDTRYVKEIAI